MHVACVYGESVSCIDAVNVSQSRCALFPPPVPCNRSKEVYTRCAGLGCTLLDAECVLFARAQRQHAVGWPVVLAPNKCFWIGIKQITATTVKSVIDGSDR